MRPPWRRAPWRDTARERGRASTSRERCASLMSPPDDNLPAPPDLPSYTVEDAVEPARARATPRASPRARCERHAGTGLVRHDVALDEDRIDADAAKVVRRLERSGYRGLPRRRLRPRPAPRRQAQGLRHRDQRPPRGRARALPQLPHHRAALPPRPRPLRRRQGRRGRHVPAQPADGSPGGRRTARPSTTSSSAATTSSARRTRTPSAATSPSTRSSTTSTAARCSTGAAACRTSRRRTIHTIGDPDRCASARIPIRILRAIKFAARLDLGIAPDVYDAMVSRRARTSRRPRGRASSRRSCGCCAAARRTGRCGCSGRRARWRCSCRSSRRSSTTRRPPTAARERFFREDGRDRRA